MELHRVLVEYEISHWRAVKKKKSDDEAKNIGGNDRDREVE